MKEFTKIQQSVGEETKVKYLTYAESHPKSFISALIIQGMINSPDADIQKMEKMFKGLDESLQNTKPGKAIKTRLDQAKTPSVGAVPPAGATPPAAGSAK
jgi:hypothetical protein